MQPTKLKINLAAGIINFVCAAILFPAAVFFAISTMRMIGEIWNFALTSYMPHSSTPGFSESYGIGFFLFWIASALPIAAAITLNIIGLVQSRKVGISIIGHILGIVGAASFRFLPAFIDFGSPILLIIAGIFCVKQKNKTLTPQAPIVNPENPPLL